MVLEKLMKITEKKQQIKYFCRYTTVPKSKRRSISLTENFESQQFFTFSIDTKVPGAKLFLSAGIFFPLKHKIQKIKDNLIWTLAFSESYLETINFLEAAVRKQILRQTLCI